MNCKNCGFPLNGNQTCPSCGTVNEINNTTTEQVVQPNQSTEPLPMNQAAPIVSSTAEAVQNVEPVQPVTPTVESPVVNNVGPTPVAPVAPEITPIQSNPNINYEPPKKKNTGLIVVLIILGLIVIGVGIFIAIKFLWPKQPDTPTVEPKQQETSKKEEEEKDPDAEYASEQIFIDTMTEDELFNLVHDTLDYTITDGQTLEEFYNTLKISKTGKKPSRISGGNATDFEFLGVMLADTKRDYISKVHVACNYDFKNSLLFNPQSDSYSRSGMVELKIYSGKGEEIYNSIKTHYSNLYPGTEVKDSKGSGGVYNGTWVQFDMSTPDNNHITVRLEEERTKDRYAILIYETVKK